MNIAFIHFRVGETDGVSLEMDKWKHELEHMGHTVYYISGHSHGINAFEIEELEYQNAVDERLAHLCFVDMDGYSEKDIDQMIVHRSDGLAQKLMALFSLKRIDLLIAHNVFSLGKSIPVALGIFKAINLSGVQVIAHHHDFYWEREKYANPTCQSVVKYLELLFPPQLLNIKHIVINALAQKALQQKKGIQSVVVPNVFDFHAKPWKIDAYNQDFLSKIGVSNQDIVFLQATRVVERKAIELAVDFVSAINRKLKGMGASVLANGKQLTSKSNIVLLIVGLQEAENDYTKNLIDHINNQQVKVVMNQDLITHTRTQTSTKKTYSLWDAYAHADFITYPSIYEGWGNQFLEAVFARKPLMLFEYPVFESDIKSFGFTYVSLGNSFHRSETGLISVNPDVMESAADETLDILFDAKTYEAMVLRNFEICEKHFSYPVLRKIIHTLIRK
ncbi:MAG: glycosyltransferase family 4 protein [Acholeplasmataceae bacterium]|nr:glycosyltransferase family 4 protein [Acholeplasmataceae bacterium]